MPRELMNPPEEYLTREELAERLKICPRSVARYYRRRFGRHVPGARSERYIWQEIHDYLTAQRQTPEPAGRPTLIQGGRRSRQEKSPVIDANGLDANGRDPNRHGLLDAIRRVKRAAGARSLDPNRYGF